MAKDLRSFLEEIRQSDPNQLIEVQREVSCKYEVIALSELFEQKKKFPMFLYQNVRNMAGDAGCRVLVNLYGDRGRYPIAFGLPKEENKMEPVLSYLQGLQAPISPVVVESKSAPVKEVVTRDEEVDLRNLPIVNHHQEDGGHYITQPILTKDPENGIYNLSFHRAMCLGPNESAMYILPGHAFDNLQKYKALGKPCPVVAAIGHHPLFGLAASTKVSKDYSEIDLAGGLLGEPVRMVPSETWGDEILVPADAEIVVEGEILLDKMVKEGPLGEWTGYFSGSKEANFVKVHAITRRSDAILVTESMGHCGNYGLCALPNEALYFQMAKQIYPHVKAIHFARSGNGWTNCYISVAKSSPSIEGVQKNVAVHLCHGFVKLIVVVDEDVDVYDEEEVLRAVALRCQASFDVDIIRGIRGSTIDPSMVYPTTHDVMIIDATWKLDRRIPNQSSLPSEVLDKFRIEDYEKQA